MVIVISLGGSLIVPDHINYTFLKKIVKIIKKYAKKQKVVMVTGGGHTAREYFHDLEKVHLTSKAIGLIGIAVTRLNARVVASFFNIPHPVPRSNRDVKKSLEHSPLVICGALGFRTGVTSDFNAADLAHYLKADFLLNLTNVDGLYTKDPTKHKNARMIPRINFNDFYKMTKKIKFKAGQHFVLDQKSSQFIKDHRIKTYILNGKDLKNLASFLRGKKFRGTIIY